MKIKFLIILSLLFNSKIFCKAQVRNFTKSDIVFDHLISDLSENGPDKIIIRGKFDPYLKALARRGGFIPMLFKIKKVQNFRNFLAFIQKDVGTILINIDNYTGETLNNTSTKIIIKNKTVDNTTILDVDINVDPTVLAAEKERIAREERELNKIFEESSCIVS